MWEWGSRVRKTEKWGDQGVSRRRGESSCSTVRCAGGGVLIERGLCGVWSLKLHSLVKLLFYIVGIVWLLVGTVGWPECACSGGGPAQWLSPVLGGNMLEDKTTEDTPLLQTEQITRRRSDVGPSLLLTECVYPQRWVWTVCSSGCGKGWILLFESKNWHRDGIGMG